MRGPVWPWTFSSLSINPDSPIWTAIESCDHTRKSTHTIQILFPSYSFTGLQPTRRRFRPCSFIWPAGLVTGVRNEWLVGWLAGLLDGRFDLTGKVWSIFLLFSPTAYRNHHLGFSFHLPSSYSLSTLRLVPVLLFLLCLLQANKKWKTQASTLLFLIILSSESELFSPSYAFDNHLVSPATVPNVFFFFVTIPQHTQWIKQKGSSLSTFDYFSIQPQASTDPVGVLVVVLCLLILNWSSCLHLLRLICRGLVAFDQILYLFYYLFPHRVAQPSLIHHHSLPLLLSHSALHSALFGCEFSFFFRKNFRLICFEECFCVSPESSFPCCVQIDCFNPSSAEFSSFVNIFSFPDLFPSLLLSFLLSFLPSFLPSVRPSIFSFFSFTPQYAGDGQSRSRTFGQLCKNWRQHVKSVNFGFTAVDDVVKCVVPKTRVSICVCGCVFRLVKFIHSRMWNERKCVCVCVLPLLNIPGTLELVNYLCPFGFISNDFQPILIAATFLHPVSSQFQSSLFPPFSSSSSWAFFHATHVVNGKSTRPGTWTQSTTWNARFQSKCFWILFFIFDLVCWFIFDFMFDNRRDIGYQNAIRSWID